MGNAFKCDACEQYFEENAPVRIVVRRSPDSEAVRHDWCLKCFAKARAMVTTEK